MNFYNEKAYKKLVTSITTLLPQKFLQTRGEKCYPFGTDDSIFSIANSLTSHLYGVVSPIVCQFLKEVPNLFVLGDDEGYLHIFNAKYQHPKQLKKSRLHYNTLFDVSFQPTTDGQICLSAGGDKLIKLWDIESDSLIHGFQGHIASVKSIDFCWANKNVFASGSRDGSIKIWDVRICYKASDTIFNAHQNGDFINKLKSNKENNSPIPRDSKYYALYAIPNANYKYHSVTSVTFQDEHKIISCGASDGKVKIWDLRKIYSCAKKTIPCATFCANLGSSSLKDSSTSHHGYTHLKLDSTRTKIFANSYNGYAVHVFDTQRYTYVRNNNSLFGDLELYPSQVRTYSKLPKHIYTPKTPPNSDVSKDTGMTWCSSFYDKIDISPLDMYLISGSSTGNAYIWKILEDDDSPDLYGYQFYQSPDSEISCVAWSPTDLSRFAISDSESFQFWSLKVGEDNPDSPSFDLRIMGGKEVCDRSTLASFSDNDLTLSPTPDPSPPSQNINICSPVDSPHKKYAILLTVPTETSSNNIPGSPKPCQNVRTELSSPTQALPNYTLSPYRSAQRCCRPQCSPLHKRLNPISTPPCKRLRGNLDSWVVKRRGRAINSLSPDHETFSNSSCASQASSQQSQEISPSPPLGWALKDITNGVRDIGYQELVEPTTPVDRLKKGPDIKCKRISDYFAKKSNTP